MYTHTGNLPSIWYSHPPFRVHHEAKQTIELEWDNECEGTGSNLISLGVVYQPDGSYLIQEGNDSPSLEVRVTRAGNCEFRVEAAGLSMNVTIAAYLKVKPSASCSKLRVSLETAAYDVFFGNRMVINTSIYGTAQNTISSSRR